MGGLLGTRAVSLDDALAKLPEVYQTIRVGDRVIPGLRDCETRLAVLRGDGIHGEVVLEVGSSLGFFSRGLADDNLVVSVEQSAECVAVQLEALRVEPRQMLLVRGSLTRTWVEAVTKTCTVFDSVLLLSVLHHMPRGDVQSIFRACKALARKVYTEIAEDGESNACGPDSRSVYLPRGEVLYRERTHLGGLRDIAVHRGSTSRKVTRSYVGSPYRGELSLEFDGEWRFEKQGVSRPYAPGVLLWDIRLLGPIVWPLDLVDQFDALLDPSMRDVMPWNLIYTREGLQFIDTEDEASGPGDPEGTRRWLQEIGA